MKGQMKKYKESLSSKDKVGYDGAGEICKRKRGCAD
jgi:hypothetical protein